MKEWSVEGLITARRTPKYPGENQPECCSGHHKTHMGYPVAESGPPGCAVFILIPLELYDWTTLGSEKCEPIINDVHSDGEGGRLKIQGKLREEQHT
jgi:hypothetical protein